MKKFMLFLLLFSFVGFGAAGCAGNPNERKKTYAEEIDDLQKFYEESFSEDQRIQEEILSRHNKIYEERMEEIKNMTSEDFIAMEKERCGRISNVDYNVFCPCYAKKLIETLTDKTKEMFLKEYFLCAHPLECKTMPEEEKYYKDYFEQRRIVSLYCEETVGGVYGESCEGD